MTWPRTPALLLRRLNEARCWGLLLPGTQKVSEFGNPPCTIPADSAVTRRQKGHGWPHSGGLKASAYVANMRLKLMLMRSRSLRLASTEWGSQAGNRIRLPVATGNTTWSVL